MFVPLSDESYNSAVAARNSSHSCGDVVSGQPDEGLLNLTGILGITDRHRKTCYEKVVYLIFFFLHWPESQGGEGGGAVIASASTAEPKMPLKMTWRQLYLKELVLLWQ